MGQFSDTDGATGFGGSVTGNLTGPLSLQAGYTLTTVDDVDSNVNSFHAGLGYEIPNLQFSACPFVGAQYSIWSEEFTGVDVDMNQMLIPVGFGIGKSLAAGPNLNLTLYGAPQFLYFRTKFSASDGVDSVSETESSSEFGAELGFRLGGSALFGGASASFSSVEESDPVFTVGIGLTLGGRR